MFHIYIWKWSKLLDEDLLALLVSLLLNERTNKKHARHNNSGFLKTHQHKLWGGTSEVWKLAQHNLYWDLMKVSNYVPLSKRIDLYNTKVISKMDTHLQFQ